MYIKFVQFLGFLKIKIIIINILSIIYNMLENKIIFVQKDKLVVNEYILYISNTIQLHLFIFILFDSIVK